MTAAPIIRGCEKVKDMDPVFIIRKNILLPDPDKTPWLLSYGPSGCSELMADGQRHTVYTCIWGNRRQDAKVFVDEAKARALARQTGACVITTKRRENHGLEDADR